MPHFGHPSQRMSSYTTYYKVAISFENWITLLLWVAVHVCHSANSTMLFSTIGKAAIRR